MEPSICPRQSRGFTTRPTSCAATHALDPPVGVQDHDLGGEAVGRVRLDPRYVRAEGGGVVHDLVRGVDAAGEFGEASAGVEVGPQLPGRARDGSSAEEGGPRAGRLAAAQSERRVHLRVEDGGREPRDLDRELHQHRQQPLAHLRVAVVERDRAVRLHDEPALAPLGDAVADAAVLEPAGDPDRLPRATGAVVRVLHRVERLAKSHRLLEHLAGGHCVADGHGVAAADLPAVEADFPREQVQAALDGERRLRYAEAAHGPARRVVGVNSKRLHVHSRHAVRAAGVARRALQHLAADRGVGPRVADETRHDRGEPPLGVAADRVVEANRVPLRVHPDGFLAAEDELDRPARDQREERRLRLDRHVLLAAESPAARHQLHVDALLRHAEEARHLPPVVEDALALRVEGQPAVRRPAPRARPPARGRGARSAACARCRSRRGRSPPAPRPRRPGEWPSATGGSGASG